MNDREIDELLRWARRHNSHAFKSASFKEKQHHVGRRTQVARASVNRMAATLAIGTAHTSIEKRRAQLARMRAQLEAHR